MFKRGWDNITLFKFQQIDAINSSDKPELDKTLFCTCAVFNLTEYQLDNMSLKKVENLLQKVNKIFSSAFQSTHKTKIGKWIINYDIGKMCFGQYVELCFYLSSKPIFNAHKILASISNVRGKKNDSEAHEEKSQYFLSQPITKVAGSIAAIIQSMQEFNGQYKALFGLDEEVHGPEAKVHPFNKNYGWVYAASQIAEYERITLEEAYKINVRQAMHDLTYLKAKNKYDHEQLQQKR